MEGADRFRARFNEWLDRCLATPAPKEVRAFSFVVSERELSSVVELNGAAEFDPGSRGWTWAEVWQPPAPKFRLPRNDGAPVKRDVLGRLKGAIGHYLERGVFARRLLAREAIAVEILDGPFELVWSRGERPAPDRLAS